jgi:hypothetical protein
VQLSKTKRQNPALTPGEEASLLKTAERLRNIGRKRPFTEDEADSAYAIQELLKDEPLIPLETLLTEIGLKEIDRDLGRPHKALGQKANRQTTLRRKA